MRIMDDLIAEEGLDKELEDRVVAGTGNTNFWLGFIRDLDAASDDDSDPEAAAKQRVEELRAEAEDRSSFIAAAGAVLDCRHPVQDLERCRMQLEDLAGLR